MWKKRKKLIFSLFFALSFDAAQRAEAEISTPPFKSEKVFLLRWGKGAGSGLYWEKSPDALERILAEDFPEQEDLDRVLNSANHTVEASFDEPRGFLFSPNKKLYQQSSLLIVDLKESRSWSKEKDHRLKTMKLPLRFVNADVPPGCICAWESFLFCKEQISVLTIKCMGTLSINSDAQKSYDSGVIAYLTWACKDAGEADIYCLIPSNHYGGERGSFIVKFSKVPFNVEEYAWSDCEQANVQGYKVYLSPTISGEGRQVVDFLNHHENPPKEKSDVNGVMYINGTPYYNEIGQDIYFGIAPEVIFFTSEVMLNGSWAR